MPLRQMQREPGGAGCGWGLCSSWCFVVLCRCRSKIDDSELGKRSARPAVTLVGGTGRRADRRSGAGPGSRAQESSASAGEVCGSERCGGPRPGGRIAHTRNDRGCRVAGTSRSTGAGRAERGAARSSRTSRRRALRANCTITTATGNCSARANSTDAAGGDIPVIVPAVSMATRTTSCAASREVSRGARTPTARRPPTSRASIPTAPTNSAPVVSGTRGKWPAWVPDSEVPWVPMPWCAWRPSPVSGPSHRCPTAASS